MARVALVAAVLLVACGVAFANPPTAPTAPPAAPPAAPTAPTAPTTRVAPGTPPATRVAPTTPPATVAAPASTPGQSASNTTSLAVTVPKSPVTAEEEKRILDAAIATTGATSGSSSQQTITTTGRKFAQQAVVTRVILVLVFSNPTLASAASAKLSTAVASGTLGGVVVTPTVTPVTTPTGPSVGNTPTGAVPPSAPTTARGNYTTLVAITFRDMTRQQFDTTAQATARTSIASAAGVTTDKVRFVGDFQQVSTSRKFTTAGTNLVVTAEVTTTTQNEANQVLQRIRDAVFNNGGRLGAFAVVSVNSSGAGPSSSAAVARPVLALFALVATLAALMF